MSCVPGTSPSSPPYCASGSHRTTALEAVRRLQAAGVPASTIEEPAQVFEGEHVAARKLLSTIQHPRLGAIPAMEQPVHFGGLPRARQRPAQGSASTIERCSRAGSACPPTQIDRLAADRAIHGEPA